jgi:lipopolysaccharide/colanic/teichoic acid biosynthesis glycosyltransferase
MDIVGAIIGLILALIAFIIFAPVIKIQSPGPVFFTQTRIGKNGRRFKFYKFRTMYKDAEARKKELLDKNEISGNMFKMENDPRIIPIGHFLRKYSIDELPQFWNVLIGDMSLVGTRPPLEDEYERYALHHKARLSIKPGLTGMWQVSGRSKITDFEDVVKLDTEYINHWSFGLDIRILLKTVKAVFTKDGAM